MPIKVVDVKAIFGSLSGHATGLPAAGGMPLGSGQKFNAWDASRGYVGGYNVGYDGGVGEVSIDVNLIPKDGGWFGSQVGGSIGYGPALTDSVATGIAYTGAHTLQSSLTTLDGTQLHYILDGGGTTSALIRTAISGLTPAGDNGNYYTGNLSVVDTYSSANIATNVAELSDGRLFAPNVGGTTNKVLTKNGAFLFDLDAEPGRSATVCRQIDANHIGIWYFSPPSDVIWATYSLVDGSQTSRHAIPYASMASQPPEAVPAVYMLDPVGTKQYAWQVSYSDFSVTYQYRPVSYALGYPTIDATISGSYITSDPFTIYTLGPDSGSVYSGWFGVVGFPVWSGRLEPAAWQGAGGLGLPTPGIDNNVGLIISDGASGWKIGSI